MQLIGFDSAVARKNGYPTAVPFDYVEGSCGIAFVYLSRPASMRYTVRTGWGINKQAILYNWSVQVTGPSWNKTHKWSGTLAFRSTWEATTTQLVTKSGEYFARAWGSSTMPNGAVCGTIDGPTAFADIW